MLSVMLSSCPVDRLGTTDSRQLQAPWSATGSCTQTHRGLAHLSQLPSALGLWLALTVTCPEQTLSCSTIQLSDRWAIRSHSAGFGLCRPRSDKTLDEAPAGSKGCQGCPFGRYWVFDTVEFTGHDSGLLVDKNGCGSRLFEVWCRQDGASVSVHG